MADKFEKIIDAVKELSDETIVPIVSPASKELGGFFGAIAGFFNNVLAAPLHRLNARFKAKTIAFIADLEKEHSKIPEENRIEPALNIVGPVLEKLKFCIEEDELKNLYSKLLLSAMDNRKSKNVHPIFVDIISKFNEIDAIIFKKAYEERYKCFVAERRMSISNREKKDAILKELTSTFPSLFVIPPLSSELSLFEVSNSLRRLQAFGLIEVDEFQPREKDIQKVDDYICEKSELMEIINKFSNNGIKISFACNVFFVNELGLQFAECCL